jgi:hypothetical protein
MNSTLNESTLRSQAIRQGYQLRKSRRQESLNNQGGFMIVDRDRNFVVAGDRFDLDLADVAEWLKS